MLASAGCGSETSAPQASGTTGATPETLGTQPSGTPRRCVVRLHGKGGTGGDTSETDGVTAVFPTGNADGWGGRQWLYFPESSYIEARDIVAAAGAECTRFVLDGFSNGAAFAAKLYCRGETFDARLVGVVIDDPVPDEGASGCTPSPDVAGALYWTGGLEPQAQPGTECATIDWTCEGGTIVGIEAYARSLGLDVQPSPFTDHERYLDAPEIHAWLGD